MRHLGYIKGSTRLQGIQKRPPVFPYLRGKGNRGVTNSINDAIMRALHMTGKFVDMICGNCRATLSIKQGAGQICALEVEKA